MFFITSAHVFKHVHWTPVGQLLTDKQIKPLGEHVVPSKI